jgi:hypothetical protein
MDKPLSAEQVKNAMDNKVNFLTYPELFKYDNIEDALGPYKKLILLYLTQKDFGHYVCVFINDYDELHFFDSYGDMPDDQLKYIPEYFRYDSGQYIPHLTYLLWKSDNDVFFNEFKLQKMSPKIATCGRWCIGRLLLPNLTEKEFADIFLNKKDSPDKIITNMTKFIS